MGHLFPTERLPLLHYVQAVLKRNLLPRRGALEGRQGVVDRFEIQKVKRVLKFGEVISHLRCIYVGLSGLGGLYVVFVLRLEVGVPLELFECPVPLFDDLVQMPVVEPRERKHRMLR
ncbi:hypothetical protein GGQ15_002508 [Salinibacter ruber]|nr:hypothetical protein [Salinibacter ruber]MCS4142112.1 hypothetical protein [Salinibacter ruber]